MEQLDDETRRQSPLVLHPLSPVRTVNGRLIDPTSVQGDRKPLTPGRYFEELLTTGQRDLVTITPRETRLPVAVTVPEMEMLTAPSNIQRLDTGSSSPVSTVWRLGFDVTNRNSQLIITLVDLDIQWERDGHSYHRRFLQAVWIPPASSQHLYAWFPTEVDSANVHLRDVRGRPAVERPQR
jgi:hypothetical protein